MWLGTFHSLDPKKTGKKIACLVPSLTEWLIDMGLNHQLVARTKFCIHPKDKVSEIPTVGGTKKVHINKLKSWNPYIVIGNKEENTKEDLEAISDFAPVFVSDIKTIPDLDRFIRSIAEVIPELRVNEFLTKLKKSKILPFENRLKVAYIIWQNPLMVVASETYIDHVLSISGLENVFASHKRYPETSFEELRNLKPDIILLSSEPYPFKNKHIATFSQECPFAKPLLVDGEIFSWYGSKTLQIGSYIEKLQKLVFE